MEVELGCMDSAYERELVKEIAVWITEHPVDADADEDTQAEQRRAIWHELLATFAHRYPGEGDLLDLLHDNGLGW